MPHHRAGRGYLLHARVPDGRAGHPHVRAPRPHPHLGHHVGDILTLRCHPIFWGWWSIAHSVLHCWVARAHHVPLHVHPGHHPVPVTLHHPGVAGGPRHASHGSVRTIRTHGPSHHHSVRAHHFHTRTIWHHVGHGLPGSHHPLLLHPHSHHCHLLRIHRCHAGMHLLLIHHLHISSHPRLAPSHVPHHAWISSHLGHSLVSHHGITAHTLPRPGPGAHVVRHAVWISKSKTILCSCS